MGNRVVKFRGKRVDNGEWAYGYYQELEESENHYYWINEPNGDITDVIPETIGQYAGWKDRKGVNIYEGDVILELTGEHAQGVWEYSNVSVVEDLRCIPESLGFADCTYIIGNIHENPELMGKKK